MAIERYVLDYRDSENACEVEWTFDQLPSKKFRPFIDYIRCDLDGVNYAFLNSNEAHFREVKISGFKMQEYLKPNVFKFLYLAWVEIDLALHPIFREALKFSENAVEPVLGFRVDSEIFETCYEPIKDYPVQLLKD